VCLIERPVTIVSPLFFRPLAAVAIVIAASMASGDTAGGGTGELPEDKEHFRERNNVPQQNENVARRHA
jgi:hypothetical protein